MLKANGRGILLESLRRSMSVSEINLLRESNIHLREENKYNFEEGCSSHRGKYLTRAKLIKGVMMNDADEVKPCLEEPLILLDNIYGIEPINIRKGFNREEIVSEVKRQMLLAGPLVTVSFLSFFLQVISVMFVGHLGELALSGASMATSFASVTGFSLLRLSDELEKLKHTASSFPEESETEEEDIVEIDDAAEEVHENEPPVIGEPLVKTTPEIPSPQKDIERQLH
ncbi:hypothetical protein ACFE04_015054 [Oxalis oulophora]